MSLELWIEKTNIIETLYLMDQSEFGNMAKGFIHYPNHSYYPTSHHVPPPSTSYQHEPSYTYPYHWEKEFMIKVEEYTEFILDSPYLTSLPREELRNWLKPQMIRHIHTIMHPPSSPDSPPLGCKQTRIIGSSPGFNAILDHMIQNVYDRMATQTHHTHPPQVDVMPIHKPSFDENMLLSDELMDLLKDNVEAFIREFEERNELHVLERFLSRYNDTSRDKPFPYWIKELYLSTLRKEMSKRKKSMDDRNGDILMEKDVAQPTLGEDHHAETIPLDLTYSPPLEECIIEKEFNGNGDEECKDLGMGEKEDEISIPIFDEYNDDVDEIQEDRFFDPPKFDEYLEPSNLDPFNLDSFPISESEDAPIWDTDSDSSIFTQDHLEVEDLRDGKDEKGDFMALDIHDIIDIRDPILFDFSKPYEDPYDPDIIFGHSPCMQNLLIAYTYPSDSHSYLHALKTIPYFDFHFHIFIVHRLFGIGLHHQVLKFWVHLVETLHLLWSVDFRQALVPVGKYDSHF